jgi:cytochrome P450
MAIPPPDIHHRAGSTYPDGPNFLARLTSIFRGNSAEFMQAIALRHGDLAHYRIGTRHIFQFNHPDLINEFLIRDTPHHLRGIVMQRSRFVLGDGLLTSEEPLHMRQRRLAQPAFHRHRITAYGAIISSYALEMSNRWEAGNVIDLHAQMLLLALRIVGKCLFDTDVEEDVRRIAAAVDAFMSFLPLAFLPFSAQIQRLPLPVMRRIHRGRDELDGLIFAMIAERRAHPGDRGDLLSMLLAANAGEQHTGRMSDQQIRDECLTVLLAGHETTANALSFALWLLATHPEIQETLHLEASQLLGSRPPTANDYPNLPYAAMVFAESMRLYPPVWVIARTAAHKYEFRGFPIPAGSLLVAPQCAVHRDARFHPDPARFNPKRFTEAETLARPRFAYFPFGAGSRQCIGEGLAWMEGVLVLATIAQHWRVTPPGNPAPGPSSTTPAPSLPVTASITLRPTNGLPLRVILR